jgi:ribosomal-protein-alanine N-acetyltransferase
VTAPGSGPVLLTERLRLAPCAEADVDRLHALLTHPDVRRYLLDDKVVERSWVFDVVESSRRTFADARYGLWCVESRADGAFVGLAGLRVTAGAAEPQLLYALDPSLWGRGFATEASTAVVDYAFDELEFEELLASTDPPNGASIRVMDRLGLRFLEAVRVAGQRIVFYRIGRGEWARRRAARAASSAPGAGSASASDAPR